jgi:hypothetical protein
MQGWKWSLQSRQISTSSNGPGSNEQVINGSYKNAGS